MRLAVKSRALPVYKKNRIASLLCIFESIIVQSVKLLLASSLLYNIRALVLLMY